MKVVITGTKATDQPQILEGRAGLVIVGQAESVSGRGDEAALVASGSPTDIASLVVGLLISVRQKLGREAFDVIVRHASQDDADVVELPR